MTRVWGSLVFSALPGLAVVVAGVAIFLADAPLFEHLAAVFQQSHWAAEALMAATFCAAPLGFLWRNGRDAQEILGLVRPRASGAAWCALAVALMLPLLIALLERVLAAEAPQSFYRDSVRLAEAWQPRFAVIVLAPLAEELFFRGYLLGGSIHSGASRWMAVLVTSLVFGLIHGNQYQLSGIVISVGLGAAFAAMRLASSSLAIPVLAHMLVNGHRLFL